MQGLAERLQLTSLPMHLVDFHSSRGRGLYSKEMALESSPLEYLAHSYERANKEMTESCGADLVQLIQKCKGLIGQMAG